MAKSFFAMGHAAGFDMTTQDGMNAFMLAFNSGLAAQQSAPHMGQPARQQRPRAATTRATTQRPSKRTASVASTNRVDPASLKVEKMRRKQQEQAEKRNRKRK
jgi:hypothetical protein